MLPRVIVHNSVSLDGSLINFDVDMKLHYQLASRNKPDAHLIGSNTIKIGIDLYGNSPPEARKDFKKPNRDKNLPYWIIIDSKGILQYKLHEVRRFEFCKDVIVLTSNKTPDSYLSYLKERNYFFHIVGNEHVNLQKSLQLLYKKYNVKIILTDCGRILSNLLLNQDLVDEISLLFHPVIVGDKSYNIFNNTNKKIKLKLLKNKILNRKYIWLVYNVIKT
jgi:2,5-diamino-6-(ribosylamino)-4(3H)-pyrimidinone 5'-phosphate reductase